MKAQAVSITGSLVRWLEIGLAILVVIAVIIAFSHSFMVLAGRDWSSVATFYEAVDRILIIVIGLELVRMLIVRRLVSVLELLAFVVARKMLSPDLTSLDIMLGSVAFILLIIARYALGYYHRKIEDGGAELP